MANPPPAADGATFAQIEATSYRILVAGAQATGLSNVESLCRALLADEKQFAEWVVQQAEPVTRHYLTVQRSEA